MPRLPLFAREFLLLLAGPLVWALHFAAVYALAGLVCARPAPDAQALAWGVAGLGVAALALLAIVLFSMRSRAPAPQDRALVRQVGLGLAALAALAIAWETLPVFLADACSRFGP